MNGLLNRQMWFDPEGRPIDVRQADFLCSLPRSVGNTRLRTVDGEISISTVFLVLDHNLLGSGAPVLWETMIFGGKYDGHQWRWGTYVEAQAGHAAIVATVRVQLEQTNTPIMAATERPVGAVLRPTGAATHREHLIQSIGRRRLGRHRARYNRIRRQQAKYHARQQAPSSRRLRNGR